LRRATPLHREQRSDHVQRCAALLRAEARPLAHEFGIENVDSPAMVDFVKAVEEFRLLFHGQLSARHFGIVLVERGPGWLLDAGYYGAMLKQYSYPSGDLGLVEGKRIPEPALRRA